MVQDMTQSTGQSFLVENRPGANAIIATELVARSPNDGYTLLFSSLSLLVNAILIDSKVKYDPFKDFAPVSNAALLPMAIVAKLNEEMHKSLARPETKERMKQLGAIIVGDTPAEYAAFLKKDYARWEQVIKASGVKAE